MTNSLPIPKDKKLVSISEAAEILGVSIDTIRRWDKADILHSSRPDGKTRYFSLEELEQVKFSQPLGISEASKQLGISTSTLRRLEKKRIIKPKRDKNGERIYDCNSLKNFLNSEYFLRKKDVEEKILEPLKEPLEEKEMPEEQKEKREETTHKILGAIFSEQREKISSLIRFRKTFYAAGLFLTTLLILIVSIITILFLFFPQQTAKFFGYRYPQGGNVLGARYPDKPEVVEGQVLGEVLKPLSAISLRVVQQVSPKTYEQIVPSTTITDVNDVLKVNQGGNLTPLFTFALPDSSYLKVPDQGLIANLNADYLQGKVPGDKAGEIIVWGENGKVAGLKIDQTNLGDGVVTSAKIASGTFNAIVPTQSGNNGKFLTTSGTDVSWASAITKAYTTVQEEGTSLTQRNVLNFVGAGFTAADDSSNSRTNVSMNSGLNDIAGLSITDGNFIVSNGVSWVAESASTARVSLGLSIGSDVQAYSVSLAAIAAGTWTGASSITTLGTITSGTWSGTTIATGKGGTGLTTIAAGSVLAANTLDTLSVVTSTSGLKVLQDSSGTISWASTTGTGNVVFDTSPTLVTPILGEATATTINKITLTQPAAGSTLTLIDGKTLTINKTISFTAADDTGVYTLPTGTKTLLAADGNGSALTSLAAGNLSGTIPSAVLENSTVYIGTTAIALNRATASQALTGITSIDGSAATVTNGVYTNAANSFSLINPLTTIAESWIGPSSTTGVYFKGGNVGIGTTNPSATFDVRGNIYLNDGTAGTPAFSFNADTNTGFYRQSNDLISFVANGQNALNVSGTSGAGRLMVGNGDPVSRFQINADENIASTGITLGGTASTYIQIYKSGSNQLAIMGGNVGIGTTAPASMLDISSTNPTFRMTDTTASAKSLLVDVDANVVQFREVAGAAGSLLTLDMANNRVGIGTTAPGSPLSVNGGISAGTYSATAAPSNGMIISGNIGVGTSNPLANMQFADKGSIDSSAGYEMTFRNNNYYSGSDKWLNTGHQANALAMGDSGFRFFSSPDLSTAEQATTNWSVKMTLDNSGVLGFSNGGHIELAVGTPQLYMAGSDANWTYGKYNSPAGAVMVTAAAVVQGVGQVDNEGWMIKGHSGTSAFEVSGTGNVYARGNVGIGVTGSSYKLQVQTATNEGHVAADGTWGSSSDIRLKQNITTLDTSLDKVMKLRGVRYDFISEPKSQDNEGKHIGFIAQEVEGILPEVVSTDNSGIKSVSYALLAPLLVNAIGEQQTQIKAQDDILAHIKTSSDGVTLDISPQGLEVLTTKISVLQQKIDLAQETPKQDAQVLTLSSLNVEGLATISASLRVKENLFVEGILNVVDSLTTNNLIVSSLADFLDSVIFRGDVAFLGRPTFNKDTAGFAVIAKGADTVEVSFEKEYAQTPIVNASITLDDKGTNDQSSREFNILSGDLRYIVTRRSTKGFTIKLNHTTSDDITFSWNALMVKDPNTSISKQIIADALATKPLPSLSPTLQSSPSGQASTPTPSPSPSPTPTPALSVPEASSSATLNAPKSLTVSSNELGFLRVRSDPLAASLEVAQVLVGQTFPVVEESPSTGSGSSRWYKIEYEAGKFGWVSGVYVTIQ